MEIHKSIKALFLFITLLFVSLGPASVRADDPPIEKMPGNQVILRADPTYHPARVLAPPKSDAQIQSATFIVTYNGFTPEAQAAFQYAVDIWANLVVSPVPIRVQANFTPQGSNILGSAGPENYFRNFPNAPTTDWYPVALANAVAGFDLDPGNADISANFNSNLPDWYFGTDGNTPFNRYDFVSVVLHELGHGLGFLGNMQVTNGLGRYFNPPDIYDRFAVDAVGTSLLTYPNNSAQLAAPLRGGGPGAGGTYFNGSHAMVANGNALVKLYTPGTWSSGSSYSHLDEVFNNTPNSLMTFSLANGESEHSPGPVTLGMFQDWGWTVTIPAELTLTKSATTSVTVGDNLTYSLEVVNNTSVAANNILISDPVPANSTYVNNSASHSGTKVGNNIQWTITSLGAGASATRTFMVTANTGVANGTIITNTASVTASNISASQNSNTTATTVDAPSLSLSAIVSPLTVESTTDTLTYSIQLHNSGNANATNVAITSTIPASTTYKAGSATDGGSFSSPNVVWTGLSVAQGASINVSFQVDVTDPITDGNKLENTITASSAQGINAATVKTVTVGVSPNYIPFIVKEN